MNEPDRRRRDSGPAQNPPRIVREGTDGGFHGSDTQGHLLHRGLRVGDAAQPILHVQEENTQYLRERSGNENRKRLTHSTYQTKYETIATGFGEESDTKKVSNPNCDTPAVIGLNHHLQIASIRGNDPCGSNSYVEYGRSRETQ